MIRRGSKPRTIEREAADAFRGRGSDRKDYRAPRLIVYGDLRTLTLGGSPGMGDSGPTTGVRKPL